MRPGLDAQIALCQSTAFNGGTLRFVLGCMVPVGSLRGGFLVLSGGEQ